MSGYLVLGDCKTNKNFFFNHMLDFNWTVTKIRLEITCEVIYDYLFWFEAN